MKVFATALLAATMTSTATAGSEQLYCVGQDGNSWIFLTLIENSVKSRIQGNFKGPRDEACELQLLSGACGSAVSQSFDVDTNRGGVGKFKLEPAGLSGFVGTAVNVVDSADGAVVCCEWSETNQRL